MPLHAMETTCDALIIGGAFSGAATGLLLKRSHPELHVVIVEKAEEFDRKVGESTTEVSSCFLTRVLGLTHYLGHHQLSKQGLRMWFSRTPHDAFQDCAELGARYNSRLSGFQVDRATLDEHVLEQAVAAGCELLRPAKVTTLELNGVGENRVEVRRGEETHTFRPKWVVDASGRAAVIARKRGLFRQNTEHPINSIWARFQGVKDWDGHELRAKYPCWANATRTARGWATNHLMGYGWWCWIIPLKGGDVSVGLVYDSRLFTPPEGGTIAERLKAHFECHPVGREILGEAQAVPHDQRAYSMLPYVSEQVAGDGWVLVGDAASFIDPLYSPGLDFCSFTSQIAHNLVTKSAMGECTRAAVAQYNERFAFCYQAWFQGIYRDKYYYLGDAELMAIAFLLDIGSYTLGPMRQVYSDPATQYGTLPFDGLPGRIVAKFLRFYNGRLSAIAQKRRAAGTYGARNLGWRLLIGGFVPDGTVTKLLRQGLWRWAQAEWNAFWLQPLAAKAVRAREDDPEPMPKAAVAETVG